MHTHVHARTRREKVALLPSCFIAADKLGRLIASQRQLAAAGISGPPGGGGERGSARRAFTHPATSRRRRSAANALWRRPRCQLIARAGTDRTWSRGAGCRGGNTGRRVNAEDPRGARRTFTPLSRDVTGRWSSVISTAEHICSLHAA